MLMSINACLMHDDTKNLGQVMLSGWSFLFCLGGEGLGGRGYGICGKTGVQVCFLENNCPYHEYLLYDITSIKPDCLYAQDCTTRSSILHSIHATSMLAVNNTVNSSPETLAMFNFFSSEFHFRTDLCCAVGEEKPQFLELKHHHFART